MVSPRALRSPLIDSGRVAAVLLRIAVSTFLLLLLGAVAVQAETVTGKVLQTRDRYIRQQFEKAVRMYSNGRVIDAEQLFRDLRMENNLSNRGREIITFMIGKCLYREAHYEYCINHFKEFRSEYPDSRYGAAALVYIGHSSYKLGKPDAAAMAYMRAMTQGTGKTRRIAQANLKPLVQTVLSPAALKSLAASLERDKSPAIVRLWIADRWMRLGDTRRAEELYRQIVRTARRSPSGRAAAEQLDRIEEHTARSLTLGIMAPLSGDLSSYGRQLEFAARFASERWPDRVRLHVVDTEGDSTKAEALAEPLVDLGCDAVIGPLAPSVIRASAAVFKKRGVLQILPLARRDDFTGLSPDLFQMSNPPAEQGRRLAEWATTDGGMSIFGVLASNTPDGHAAAEAFARTVRHAGDTVYDLQFFDPGDTDFGPQLRAIKKQAAPDPWPVDEDEEPLPLEDVVPILDGMLLWGYPEELILMVPQVVFHGFRVGYLGPATWGETDALSRIRSALDSATFVSNEWIDRTRPQWRVFDSTYTERWGQPPTGLAGKVYDLVNWLAGGDQIGNDTASLEDRLKDPQGFVGATGAWRFGEDRLPAELPIYHYVDGVPHRLDGP